MRHFFHKAIWKFRLRKGVNVSKKRRKKKVWPKVLWGMSLALSIFAGFWIARTQIVFSSINQDTDNVLKEMELPKGDYKSDKKIVNILIVGNDYRKETNYTAAGLPDVMMIATLDKKHKTLKLTSLLRDQVVQIPEHGENRLNYTYSCSEAGIDVLYQTIAANYNIKLDGYVELGFDAVRETIDKVGGIQVELTESEANYLNSTNYIRPKKYRNVKPGMNTLNGAQALGYSRIRKTVYTPTGLTDDYGRTWRQRNVVNAVFNQVKGMSLNELLDITQEMLGKYVKTDLSSADIAGYATDVVMMGSTEIYQLQIPMEGYYTNNPSYGALGDVLVPDIESNKEALYQFLFEYKGSKNKEFVYAPGGVTATTAPVQ